MRTLVCVLLIVVKARRERQGSSGDSTFDLHILKDRSIIIRLQFQNRLSFGRLCHRSHQIKMRSELPQQVRQVRLRHGDSRTLADQVDSAPVEIKAANPKLMLGYIAKMTQAMWRALSPAEREAYEERMVNEKAVTRQIATHARPGRRTRMSPRRSLILNEENGFKNSIRKWRAIGRDHEGEPARRGRSRRRCISFVELACHSTDFSH
jgi:hypothetical protein